MKFINTLEETGGAEGEIWGGGLVFEKVSLGLWLNPGQGHGGTRQHVHGVEVGTPGLVQVGCRDEGWRHKPVQFPKSFMPWRGQEQGRLCFMVW